MVQSVRRRKARLVAMACREFSLWYNENYTGDVAVELWLVGNSRYGTIGLSERDVCELLWLVGNSRYGTIRPLTCNGVPRYGL